MTSSACGPDLNCCPKSLNSLGIFHTLDCPRFCPAHVMFDCPDGPHYADLNGDIL